MYLYRMDNQPLRAIGAPGGVRPPSAVCGLNVLSKPCQRVSPSRNSEPVSNTHKYTHTFSIFRRRRSMNTFESIGRAGCHGCEVTKGIYVRFVDEMLILANAEVLPASDAPFREPKQRLH